jgi:hypothetical protein
MCEKVLENGYFFSHWDLEGARLSRTLVYGRSTVVEQERLLYRSSAWETWR